MQRTFVTDIPEQLASNQVVVDLPRYEGPLSKALLRRDVRQSAAKFMNDDDTLNIPPTTLNNIKMFVDELALVDTEMDVTTRIPYTNFVGLHFKTAKEAVAWARSFVNRYFPATEERLLKRQLLTLPLDKTEIIWIGGDKYLSFVEAVATSPSTDELVRANTPSASSVPQAPQLTIEEAKAKRAEIASRRASSKNGTKGPEAQTASTEA